ncbi:hypothetical protein [Streptacidiphilus jiangxiensis]|uniref:Uncharacterized protein n=1 Tax=Streptacidiphilus jiangxiensis TaxID=235985 RepID=A0A1H7VX12_STRJI|nr:hypothetical protein [Streptacidiphilus jiangxiensis]SEM13419.1 hypothetical protein SAMN05414137_11939 [Streptacidiphilus jiangxiensis]
MRFKRALTAVVLAGGIVGAAAMPASAATATAHQGISGGFGYGYSGPIHAGKKFSVQLDATVYGYKGLIIACLTATDNLNKAFKPIVCTKPGHKQVKLVGGHAVLNHSGNWLLAPEVDKIVTIHGKQVLVPIFRAAENVQLVHVSK